MFESPKANDDHEPCKAASNYVPQRTNTQTHHTGSLTTSKVMRHDIRLPPEATTDKTTYRNIPAKLRATANAKLATICCTALQGKPNVDGTYNVNGQVMLLQELQKQIRHLEHRN